MAYEFDVHGITALVAFQEHPNTIQADLFRHTASLHDESYAIQIDAGIKLVLDTAIPVQPKRLELQEHGFNRIANIEHYLGIQMVQSIVRVMKVGIEVTPITLTKDNRLAIARLQLLDSSTPDGLHVACKAMLDEHGQLDNNSLQQ